MADTVKIGCRVPAGLRLRAYDWFKGPDGDPQLREIGMIDLAGSGAHLAAPGAMLAEGDAVYTEVDSDWWNKWVTLNQGCDYLTSGAVFKGRANAKVAGPASTDPVQTEAEAQKAADPTPAADASPADAGRGKKAS